jgi:hypothetical protein
MPGGFGASRSSWPIPLPSTSAGKSVKVLGSSLASSRDRPSGTSASLPKSLSIALDLASGEPASVEV